MPYVYLIENSVNQKKYIGITKHTLEERFVGHKNASKSINNRRLYQAMRKHGIDKFSCHLIEECLSEQIFDREKHWINHYKSNDYLFGYNMTAGGEGCVDRELSEKSLKKLKKSVQAHRDSLSFEQKKKMTESANRAKVGRKESDYSRELKKQAQIKRFSDMDKLQRREHGKKSKEGVTEEGKRRQTAGWNQAFSPVRQKGFKQPLVNCPNCDKVGGSFSMKRYHFDNCKYLRSE